ncbi:MAG: thiol:disulfide interchange protein DsbA/DsbL [Xanthomonadaceae bacterium]|jgi:thiol:disulfide interchange protein DsbA|nr:thiol:disulfide interchange protein DsbA/DsbL [Xanthomonadaceae bacterium]
MARSSSARFLLCVLLWLPWIAITSPGSPVAGVDYVEIPNPAPLSPPARGKIEIVEVFGYTCPHCAHFESAALPWRQKLPSYVKFTAVPAPFGGTWNTYARAYYAAKSLGIAEKTHDAVFNAIHNLGSLPRNATDREIADFYSNYGVTAQQFTTAMNSPQVAEQIRQTGDFLRRTEVDGTPALIVNGKYRVTGGNSFEDKLRIASWLIAQEHAANK